MHTLSLDTAVLQCNRAYWRRAERRAMAAPEALRSFPVGAQVEYRPQTRQKLALAEYVWVRKSIACGTEDLFDLGVYQIATFNVHRRWGVASPQPAWKFVDIKNILRAFCDSGSSKTLLQESTGKLPEWNVSPSWACTSRRLCDIVQGPAHKCDKT